MAREEKPDLILIYIQLPDVSGLEVAEWIKEDEDLESIPIIILPENDDPDDAPPVAAALSVKHFRVASFIQHSDFTGIIAHDQIL